MCASCVYEWKYYEKSDGERPAEAFILAQDNKMQAKIFTVLTFWKKSRTGVAGTLFQIFGRRHF